MASDRVQASQDERMGRPSDYNQIFKLLSDDRRRRVLHYLVENPVREIDDLVDQIAEWGGDGRSSSEIYRENIVRSLRHVHLPKLKEAGIIDYDTDTIRYLGDPLIEQHLDLTRHSDLPGEGVGTS